MRVGRFGAVLATAILAGCAPPSVPVRPTAAPATGPEAPGPLAAPFIADTSPKQAEAWQHAMEGGVAVVAFDRRGLRLLPGCTADGAYGARGVRSKPAVAQFRGRDEIRLNLPGGIDWIERDDVLDDPMSLAFLVTGEYVNLRTRLARTELRGPCEGATHFVHGMEVGIQARVFGPPEEYSTAQDVFREAFRGGGQDRLPLCLPGRGEERDAIPLPDATCSHPLRLHLVALDEEEAFAPALRYSVQRNTCPPATYLHGEQCAPAQPGIGHLCPLGDASDCQTQCGLGSGASCNSLGWMYEHGVGVSTQLDAAIEAYENACGLQDARGCLNLARRLSEQSLPARAASLLQHACDWENSLACARLARQYAFGIGLPQHCDRAASLMQRACRLGLPTACTTFAVRGDELGDCQGATMVHRKSFLRAGCAGGDRQACALLSRGILWDLCRASPITRKEAENNVERMLPTLEAACALGTVDACEALGETRVFGRVPATVYDPVRAAAAFTRACDGGSGTGCSRAAFTLLDSEPTLSSTEPQVTKLADRGCELDEVEACALAGERHERGQGCSVDLGLATTRYRKACDSGIRRACHRLAALTMTADPAKAGAYLSTACPDARVEDEVPEGCHERAILLDRGDADDRELAARLWHRSCTAGYWAACARWGDALMDGRGGAKDAGLGATFLLRACEHGDAWGCDRLRQRGVPRTSNRRTLPPRVRIGGPGPDPCRRFELEVR